MASRVHEPRRVGDSQDLRGIGHSALIVALFCLSAGTSILLDAGVVCSNDGSHYALVRALADEHTPVIDHFQAYTHHVDIGFRNGHFYSDRPPGTAMLAVPFYVLARTVSASEEGRQTLTAGLSIAAGALAVVLTFSVGRRLGFSQRVATVAALVLAFCTPHRSYSTVLFNHALSECLLLTVVWLALGSPTLWRRLLAGLCAGYLCGVEYSAPAALAPLVLLWSPLRPWWPVALGFIAGVAPILGYHQVAFGSPFHWSYQFSVPAVFAHALYSTYCGSFVRGFLGLLFHWKAGLLLYSPILALGFFAAPRFAREHGRTGLAIVGSCVVFLLLASKHGTWGGGGGHDARYLMLIVPFLCLLVAAVFARVESAYLDRSRLAPLAAFGALCFVSALGQIVKHALAWSRDIEPFVSDFAAGRGDAGAFLRWLFPHPFAGGTVFLLALGISLSLARRQKIKRPAPPKAEPAGLAGAGEGT